MNISLEVLKDTFRKNGIRPSYHRIKVLECMHQVDGHPTAEEIFAVLSPGLPSLSKATVYNTLRVLVEVGLVRVISINGIEKRYDLELHNHGHFLCESCGAIINFPIDIDLVAAGGLEGLEITQKNVYFHGLCRDCLHHSEGNKAREKD